MTWRSRAVCVRGIYDRADLTRSRPLLDVIAAVLAVGNEHHGVVRCDGEIVIQAGEVATEVFETLAIHPDARHAGVALRHVAFAPPHLAAVVAHASTCGLALAVPPNELAFAVDDVRRSRLIGTRDRVAWSYCVDVRRGYGDVWQGIVRLGPGRND